MDRWKRLVNVTLLALLVITTSTGWLAFAVGSETPLKIIVGVHGASGLSLTLLAPAKTRIVRWGLRCAGRSRKVIGSALGALVLLTLAGGWLHSVGGWRPYLGLLPMQIHVGAASAALVPLAWHVLIHHRLRRRRWRPLLRPTDLDRRAALGAGGMIVGGTTLWLLAPGLERRASGSHEIGSGAPEQVPVTQWLFDPVPRIPAGDWRLQVSRAARPEPARLLDLAAVAAMPQLGVRAVLDCTGGWYTEQEWRGVRLADFGLASGASIEVVSATGYRRRFPAAEAATLLLATHCAGRPLSAGHGGPARLVAPGRRGFWWVKWVTTIAVLDEPWWLQPPFPLR